MAGDVVRTLLVEDNPGDARLLRELLSEVTTIRTRLLHSARLSDAVEILRNEPIDVLLLDLSLPDAHGVDTVSRANAAAPLVPIVVLTGLDDESIAVRAVSAGAQDYLVKGQVDGQLLGRAIRYAMERKRAEESARRLLHEKAARAQAEEKRSRFLAEVSRTLAATLDYEATLSSVAKLAVPLLADCCILDLVQDNGIRRAALAFKDGLETELPRDSRALATASDEEPAVRALRTGEPVMLEDVSDPVRAALALPARIPSPRSVISLPLVARSRTLGAMTFVSSERPYGYDDVALAGELAGRAALAIDNSRLYRAREEVLWVVSHDLRTPLSVMRGHIELMLSGSGTPDGLAAVDRAAAHMSRLIQDLLDVTRLDAGTLSIQPRRLGINVLLEDAEEMLRPVAEANGLTLSTDEADGLRPLRADRDRVLQVLWNLVGNAVKFTPSGGSVTVSVLPDGDMARFAVSDTGPGIPEKDLPRVFDRFWQATRSDKRGAGLGLSIARGIVEAHGGRIWVDSVLHHGTTFSFTLPFDSAAR
jgi:signal transduction histidine kinase/DNA-binding NarL/FixJ family response regulator